MAVKFWVPATTTVIQQAGDTTIDGTALNKQTTDPAAIDDADRVVIGQPTTLWRLKCTAGTITTSHGAITSVKLHARIYMSNQGPFSWDFSGNDAFVAPYVKPTGYGRKWYLPYTTGPGGAYRVGYFFTNGHNFNQAGEPSAFEISWDITSNGDSPIFNAAFWGSDNAKLSGMEFGLSVNEEALYPIGEYHVNNSFAGWMPMEGAAGNTPRWNVSQLILEVDADDPPPPPTRPLIILA